MMNVPPRLVVATLAASMLMNASASPGQSSAPAQPKSQASTFRVTDFGARCDGKTDDTAAVQKAIDAAASAGGGVVEFPTGTCLLNSCRPSSHPWFFYNLTIGSNVTLSGTTGTRLLQGPGGRHPLAPRARQVRNTVLAFGADYTVIRYQDPAYNGGFHRLEPTAANQVSVKLSTASDASGFQGGDIVAIYESTKGDVIPTEIIEVHTVNVAEGILGLKRPLSRSFPSPSLARITSLVTKNVGVRNMTVQGTEPLAVTETLRRRHPGRDLGERLQWHARIRKHDQGLGSLRDQDQCARSVKGGWSSPLGQQRQRIQSTDSDSLKRRDAGTEQLGSGQVRLEGMAHVLFELFTNLTDQFHGTAGVDVDRIGLEVQVAGNVRCGVIL